MGSVINTFAPLATFKTRLTRTYPGIIHGRFDYNRPYKAMRGMCFRVIWLRVGPDCCLIKTSLTLPLALARVKLGLG
jgi:hypothetical protein